MLDRAGQHIGDGLDAAMRMPRKSFEVIRRGIIAKIVEQQERVKFGRILKSKRAMKFYASAFKGWRGRAGFKGGSEGHFNLRVWVNSI